MDPCLGTVIGTVTFTPSLLSVVNGKTSSVTFGEATDTVEVANNIDTLCGPRQYQLLKNDGSAAPTFVSLSGPDLANLYTITASPSLDAQVGTHNLKIVTSLSLYANIASSETALTVSINGASCDPAGLLWLHNSNVSVTVD